MEQGISINKILRRVRLARGVIEPNVFKEDFITDICSELGFNDTAFRDKSAEEKLEDFLLDEDYWLKKSKKNLN